LLGELNNLSNGIGTSGFPSINYVAQTTGGETLYVQVSIIDANNNIRYLSSSNLIEPTDIESGSNPKSGWVTVGNPSGGGGGNLRLFEFVSLVQN
jgi:hypothetical protein